MTAVKFTLGLMCLATLIAGTANGQDPWWKKQSCWPPERTAKAFQERLDSLREPRELHPAEIATAVNMVKHDVDGRYWPDDATPEQRADMQRQAVKLADYILDGYAQQSDKSRIVQWQQGRFIVCTAVNAADAELSALGKQVAKKHALTISSMCAIAGQWMTETYLVSEGNGVIIKHDNKQKED